MDNMKNVDSQGIKFCWKQAAVRSLALSVSWALVIGAYCLLASP
jgi:hypothetical protein